MDTDSTWRLKFRRILLVCEGGAPQPMLQLLREYANDVTLLDLQNYFGMDYLQLPADCLVVDSHIEDFAGVGMAVRTADSRLLPALILHDDRPGWDVGCIAGPSWVPFAPDTYLDDVRVFLDEVQPVDYQDLDLRHPWLMQPWTLTMAQVEQAHALGSSPMY